MDFRTKIDISTSLLSVGHQSQLMMLGSCFAQNMGDYLSRNKFAVNVNPFGILYNPSSISLAVRRLMVGMPFFENDLVKCNGLYVSFMYHGCFSDQSKSECLSKINVSLDRAVNDLSKTDILLVTFGTAYVYSLKDTGKVVSNCHKFQASMFDRRRLSVEDIVCDWTELVHELERKRPDLKVLFTVSPVRHSKDGMHDNQLSKSTLLLAIDALVSQFDNVFYFPSYEIMMDELRDYRFYAEDMIHPSAVAVNYIWQQFGNTYFGDETKSILQQWAKIEQALLHRPFNKDTDGYKQFLRQTLLKLETFSRKYHYLNCEEEIKNLTDKIAADSV